MDKLVELYSNMLLSLNERNIRRRGMNSDTRLTAHYTCVGEDYKRGSNRLMYVGRAVNGWNAELCWAANEKFDVLSAKLKAEEIIRYWERRNLEWVKTPLPGKKRKRESYPFWYLAKRIVLALDSEATNDNWIRKLAWTNLYKISPMTGGNPWDSLCKAQLNYAKKVLDYEIRRFSPTHIIFVTDNGWLADFSETLADTAASVKFKSLVVTRPEVRNIELSNCRRDAINKTFGIEI